MALIVQVSVNQDAIAFLVVTRMSGTEEEDSVNDYKYEFIQVIDDSPVRTAKGTLKHRYGDKGWSLVNKCIKDAGFK